MKKNLFFLLALLLIFSGTVYADFYSWEDESGVKHITDYPPAAKKGKNVKVLQNDSGVFDEKPTADEKKAPSINLFITPSIKNQIYRKITFINPLIKKPRTLSRLFWMDITLIIF